MNIKEAMIIKTGSDSQTDIAKRVRCLLESLGQDVVLVPHGVEDLFITIENNKLVILLQKERGPLGLADLDIATGFKSLDECWEYARTVMKEAGIPEHSCEADVWDE